MNKIHKILKYTLLFSLLLFSLAFMMMQSPLNPLAKCKPNYDSCVYLYIGEHMGDGLIPYLDTFDQKGPLQFFINYVGTQIAGQLGVWFMQILSMSIAMFFCFKIGKKYTNSVVSACATSIIFIFLQLFYETGNFTEEFSLPFIFSGLYLFLDYFENEKYSLKRIQLFFLGFTFGSILMLRPNMTALWMVFCTYILIRSIIKKQYSFIGRCIIFFTLGGLVAVLPHIIYLGVNGALPSFYEQYWKFNLQYSSTSWGNRIRTGVVFFRSSLFLVSFAFYIIASIFEKNKNRVVVYRILLVYIVINLCLVSMSGRLYFHYAMVTLPCFIVAISKIFECGYNYIVRANKNRALQVLIAILATLVLSIGSLYDGLGTIKYTRNNSQASHVEVGRIIRENTDKDDKISVLQYDCNIYLHADRVSSSKYIYQYPISDVSDEVRFEYLNHLIEQSPVIIVSTKNISMEKLFPQKYYDFVMKNYTLIGKASEYRVYKLNSEFA
jgi:hypothetical protein